MRAQAFIKKFQDPLLQLRFKVNENIAAANQLEFVETSYLISNYAPKISVLAFSSLCIVGCIIHRGEIIG